MFFLSHSQQNAVKINIVGVGGGGTNAVERMTEERVPMVHYITINTDDASVHGSSADVKLQIGQKTTQGRGAGSNPEMGYQSALENTNQIKNAIPEGYKKHTKPKQNIEKTVRFEVVFSHISHCFCLFYSSFVSNSTQIPHTAHYTDNGIMGGGNFFHSVFLNQ